MTDEETRFRTETRSRLDSLELQIRGLAQDSRRLEAALQSKGGERGTPHRQLAELGERDKWIVGRLDQLAADDVATRTEADAHRIRQDERVRALEVRVWTMAGAAATIGSGVGAALATLW